MLSIIIPLPAPLGHHVKRIPVLISDYKYWTPSDYKEAYKNANKPKFSWDNAVAPRRSPRLARIPRVDYKCAF